MGVCLYMVVRVFVRICFVWYHNVLDCFLPLVIHYFDIRFDTLKQCYKIVYSFCCIFILSRPKFSRFNDDSFIDIAFNSGKYLCVCQMRVFFVFGSSFCRRYSNNFQHAIKNVCGFFFVYTVHLCPNAYFIISVVSMRIPTNKWQPTSEW